MRHLPRKILSILLVLTLLVPGAGFAVHAEDQNGFSLNESIVSSPDGTYSVSLEAFQKGSVTPADIVMVLDVSGSMENSTPVAFADIDPMKEYFIRHMRIYYDDQGVLHRFQDNIKVHNIAPEGTEPQWFGLLDPSDTQETQVFPSGSGVSDSYVFYTGAMEALRKNAKSFVHSIAESAETYGIDHRIAVVEFSSPVQKGSALNTHPNPYYANILSGNGTAETALVSASQTETFESIFDSLVAEGPTYSDDAMTQAERILDKNRDTSRNKIVVFFTDGGPGSYGWLHDNDQSSMSTANFAIASAGRMKKQGVKIYTIGVFNEENLSGSVGQNNLTYLGAVSSDYPDAESMTNLGERVSETYCSIGDLNMDLGSVFDGISAVIGTPVNNAGIREILSDAFVLTEAQKAEILQAFPSAVITKNEDGTTTLFIPDVDFPPVATDKNGNPVHTEDSGIFKMTFSVTPNPDKIGGNTTAVLTGDSGIYAEDGSSYALFDNVNVSVPVNENILARMIETKTPTVYADEPLEPSDFYTDKSDAVGTDVTYTVKTPSGSVFEGGVLTESGIYTVEAVVSLDAGTFTKSETVTVTVLPNVVTAMEVVPTQSAQKTYYVGDTVSLSGISLYAKKSSGKTVRVDTSDVTVSPTVLSEAGTTTVTVTLGEVSSTFTVTVLPVEAVRLTVVTAPKNPTHLYRRVADFTGLTVKVTYNNTDTEILDNLSEVTIRANSTGRIRRGTEQYTVSAKGVSTTVNMQVKLAWWQWIVMIVLFGWIWY